MVFPQKSQYAAISSSVAFVVSVCVFFCFFGHSLILCSFIDRRVRWRHNDIVLAAVHFSGVSSINDYLWPFFFPVNCFAPSFVCFELHLLGDEFLVFILFWIAFVYCVYGMRCVCVTVFVKSKNFNWFLFFIVSDETKKRKIVSCQLTVCYKRPFQWPDSGTMGKSVAHRHEVNTRGAHLLNPLPGSKQTWKSVSVCVARHRVANIYVQINVQTQRWRHTVQINTWNQIITKLKTKTEWSVCPESVCVWVSECIYVLFYRMSSYAFWLDPSTCFDD